MNRPQQDLGPEPVGCPFPQPGLLARRECLNGGLQVIQIRFELENHAGFRNLVAHVAVIVAIWSPPGCFQSS